MSNADYRRGYEDGKAFGRSMQDAIEGPDRTLYELIGGPRNGERIETGGRSVFLVPISPPLSYAYWDKYNPLSYGRPDLTIRTGEYRREDIFGRSPRTVYIYRGES